MSNSIQTILQPFLFNDSQPRCGLPSAAYTDDEFWKMECHSVFFNNWVFIGFAHELEKAGDVVPISLAGHNLVMMRNERGDIRVFHNACRHRCLQLVMEKTNVGRLLRCPYHAWAYSLDGELKASPHFGGTNRHNVEGFETTHNGLVPVRSHIWHDWIFANISGDAPPFEVYAEPLIQRLENIVDWNCVECIGTLNFGEIEANWKFIMENFIEPYHVQFVHNSTTKQPLSDHYTIIDGKCLGSGVDLDSEVGTHGQLAVSSRYLALYPNFIVGLYLPDQLGVYLNIPTGAQTLQQSRKLYTTEGQRLAEAEIEGLKDLWWHVHKEDHEMVERLQAGRTSLVAQQGGVLSPVWEDSVRAFQDLVAHDVSRHYNHYRH